MMVLDSHYINGERFTELSIAGDLTDELVHMFYTLADRLYNNHQVGRSMPRDDAKQEAVLRCIMIVGQFRGRVRGSAYNYFRSVIHHRFCDIVKQAGRTPSTFAELTDTAEDFRSAAQKNYRP